MLIRFIMVMLVIFMGIGSVLAGVVHQSRQNPAYSCLNIGNYDIHLDGKIVVHDYLPMYGNLPPKIYSPNYQYIAYLERVTTISGDESHIFIIQSTQTNFRKSIRLSALASNDTYFLLWSPDSNYIALLGSDYKFFGIYRNTGELIYDLKEDVVQIIWSEDSKYVKFILSITFESSRYAFLKLEPTPNTFIVEDSDPGFSGYSDIDFHSYLSNQHINYIDFEHSAISSYILPVTRSDYFINQIHQSPNQHYLFIEYTSPEANDYVELFRIKNNQLISIGKIDSWVAKRNDPVSKVQQLWWSEDSKYLFYHSRSDGLLGKISPDPFYNHILATHVMDVASNHQWLALKRDENNIQSLEVISQDELQTTVLDAGSYDPNFKGSGMFEGNYLDSFYWYNNVLVAIARKISNPRGIKNLIWKISDGHIYKEAEIIGIPVQMEWQGAVIIYDDGSSTPFFKKIDLNTLTIVEIREDVPTSESWGWPNTYPIDGSSNWLFMGHQNYYLLDFDNQEFLHLSTVGNPSSTIKLSPDLKYIADIRFDTLEDSRINVSVRAIYGNKLHTLYSIPVNEFYEPVLWSNCTY